VSGQRALLTAPGTQQQHSCSTTNARVCAGALQCPTDWLPPQQAGRQAGRHIDPGAAWHHSTGVLPVRSSLQLVPCHAALTSCVSWSTVEVCRYLLLHCSHQGWQWGWRAACTCQLATSSPA
jgi:hypothetical protein